MIERYRKTVRHKNSNEAEEIERVVNESLQY